MKTYSPFPGIVINTVAIVLNIVVMALTKSLFLGFVGWGFAALWCWQYYRAMVLLTENMK